MSSRRPKVLIVEDDDVLAIALHRALYCNSDAFDVMLAPTGEIGRDLMREIFIDVLVADVNLPGMSGLDLIHWAAIESPRSHSIAMTGSEMAQIRNRACDVGCLHVLQKPFEPAALRAPVLEAIDSRDRLSGTLTALSAVDLIQMLCLGRKSALVRITCNNIIGNLLVRNGVLFHATWKDFVGEKAVCEIVGVEEGIFQIGPLPDGIPPSITRDWAHVVMDAVRALDEMGRDPLRTSDSWPAIRLDDILLDEGLSPTGTTGGGAGQGMKVAASDVKLVAGLHKGDDPGRAASALLDQGFAALRSGDLSQAKIFWQAAQKLEPDNRVIELNLRKLDSMQAR